MDCCVTESWIGNGSLWVIRHTAGMLMILLLMLFFLFMLNEDWGN
jgi:hypothetical protein